jgi:hypothetical protein
VRKILNINAAAHPPPHAHSKPPHNTRGAERGRDSRGSFYKENLWGLRDFKRQLKKKDRSRGRFLETQWDVEVDLLKGPKSINKK